MDYLSPERVELRYKLPLAEIVFDFFDHLKSRTRGYASLDYHEDGEAVADLVKVDILLNTEQVDAFSAIVHKDNAYSYGLRMTKRLQGLIPRQQFENSRAGGSWLAGYQSRSHQGSAQRHASQVLRRRHFP